MSLSSASTAAVIVASVIFLILDTNSSSSSDTQRNRKKLPKSLNEWRESPIEIIQADAYWEPLREVFAKRGYTIWERDVDHSPWIFWKPDVDVVSQNGAAYATSHRDVDDRYLGAMNLHELMVKNYLYHAATAKDDRSVVIRVLAVGNEGREHLDILRRVARGPESLFSDNHCIPLLEEIEIGDTVFGVFPYVGSNLRGVCTKFMQSSVGDVVDIVMQMLEALAFLHKRLIAHRDAFRDNFLIQWHSESLKMGRIPATRPRVYLNDMEGAVQFPSTCAVEERVLVGLPKGSWEEYGRPSPPEVFSGAAYDPFLVDVWQLGNSLVTWKTTIPAIDEIIASMTEPDPSERMTAGQLLDRLQVVVGSMTQSSLLIPPLIEKRDQDDVLQEAQPEERTTPDAPRR